MHRHFLKFKYIDSKCWKTSLVRKQVSHYCSGVYFHVVLLLLLSLLLFALFIFIIKTFNLRFSGDLCVHYLNIEIFLICVFKYIKIFENIYIYI